MLAVKVMKSHVPGEKRAPTMLSTFVSINEDNSWKSYIKNLKNLIFISRSSNKGDIPPPPPRKQA